MGPFPTGNIEMATATISIEVDPETARAFSEEHAAAEVNGGVRGGAQNEHILEADIYHGRHLPPETVRVPFSLLFCLQFIVDGMGRLWLDQRTDPMPAIQSSGYRRPASSEMTAGRAFRNRSSSGQGRVTPAPLAQLIASPWSITKSP